MKDKAQKVEDETPVSHIKSTLSAIAFHLLIASMMILSIYLITLLLRLFTLENEFLTAVIRYMQLGEVILIIAFTVVSVFVTTLRLYKSTIEQRRHAIVELRIKDAQLFDRITEELNSLIKERNNYAERSD